MIAVGTRVVFADNRRADMRPEPHDGQTGTIAQSYSDAYILTFPDGQNVWASANEVTAL